MNAFGSILDTIIENSPNDVYVEKSIDDDYEDIEDKMTSFYFIKPYHNVAKKNSTKFIITINKDYIFMNVEGTPSMNSFNNPEISSDLIYETGSVQTYITKEFVYKYKPWLKQKVAEFTLHKIKSLEQTIQKNLNINNKLKRRKITKILKKEDL